MERKFVQKFRKIRAKFEKNNKKSQPARVSMADLKGEQYSCEVRKSVILAHLLEAPL